MILNTLRALTDAFNSNVYGVNIQIAGLVLDSGDPRPATMSLIQNETQATWVALGVLPPSGSIYPVIGLSLDGPVTMDGEIQGGALRRQGSVTIYARVIMRQSNTSRGMSDTYYVMDAVEKCIGAFMSSTHEADRLRNSIQVCECTNIVQLKDYLPVERDDNLLSGGVQATFRVRNLNP